jgi:hypothetical protein
MTVVTTIVVYEIDGKKVERLDEAALIIRSHWNDRDRAIIETPDGKKYTIIRSDMDMAITNAGNRR